MTSSPWLAPLVLLGLACASEPPASSRAGGQAGEGDSAGRTGGGGGSAAGGVPTGGADATGGAALGGSGGVVAGGGASAGGSGGSGLPAGLPVFVAVGYAGRRIRSIDLGLSWTDDQTLGGGGDDEFLLRAVGFGNGVFVALGYKILSSKDGKSWVAQQNPQNQWLGGVQFDGTRFVATGGYGYSAYSSDGQVWSVGGDIPNNEASRSLAFGDKQFVTATDPGNWYASSDGSSWALLSGGHATNQLAFCNGAFAEYSACSGAFSARGRASANGITLRLRDGKLERATNGLEFSPVAGSPDALEDVAVGLVEAAL